MGQHSIAEVGSRITELVELALKGGSVVITRGGEKIAELKAWKEVPGPLTDAKLRWLEEVIIQTEHQGLSAAETVRAVRDQWDR